MSATSPVTSYRQARADWPWWYRAALPARNTVVWARSLRPRRAPTRHWIRLPYYHHVFEDERTGFERQLRYFRRHGEFIDLDTAVAWLQEGGVLDGRYFCITFDDGLRSCRTHALALLVEHEATAAFFLPTDLIGAGMAPLGSRGQQFEFMDWNDVRALAAAGMTVGSHTCRHVALAGLSEDAARHELQASKHVIEAQLGVPCRHFACPWGRPGTDFLPGRDPLLARRAGYASFLTTQRGPMYTGAGFCLRRDNTFANWADYQLRYFFTREADD